MRNSKVTASAALVVVAASVAFFRYSTQGSAPGIDSRVQEDVGRALAQETLKLLGPSGHITVVVRDTTTFKQPAADAVLAGFEKEARRGGKSQLNVQRVSLDPLRPVQVPSGDFLELVRRAAPGDVLVSLMGPPVLTEAHQAALGVVKPRIVAFCPGELAERIDLRRLHEQGLLHAAILGRSWRGKSGSTAPLRNPGFDDLYLRAGATELSRLPEPTGAR